MDIIIDTVVSVDHSVCYNLMYGFSGVVHTLQTPNAVNWNIFCYLFDFRNRIERCVAISFNRHRIELQLWE